MKQNGARYCIIGAGAGGLTVARHASDSASEVVVYEQTSRIGGTWVYTDDIGRDKNDVPVHTSMYKGLRSNFPKQVMGYPDSDIKSYVSYVTPEEVIMWLEDYAEKYELKKVIMFEHQVIRVTPIYEDNKWEVIVRNLRTDKYDTSLFDFVMICNGHYSNPMIPEYPGKDQFTGLQLHSHDYRSENRFKDHDILLIGAGFSASDIAIDTVKVAKSVTISHYHPERVNFDFMPSITLKPGIASLTPTGAKFVDGTAADYSVIIYCTGYRQSFPFLSVDCGISVEENHVQPLYKHIININHSTMALIGVPFYCCPTQMMDLQARFCMQFFTGKKKLPTKEDMLLDTQKDIAERQRRGLPKKWMHKLPDDLQASYYADLAATAEIEPLKPIVMKLFDKCVSRRAENVLNYRDDIFEVVNDNEFRIVNT